MSIMLDTVSDVNARIAGRVRELRAVHGLSLDTLAAKSGVSRSMISLIERGESSPTATVLEKLAGALRVTMAEMFDSPASSHVAAGPVSRRTDQTEWKDPESGYVRRNLTPPGATQPFQLVEVHFPVGRRVLFDTGSRDAHVYQQVWILEGTMDITIGTARHRLQEGDCLAMQLDQPISFQNPGRKHARYVVGVASGAAPRRI
jgi:transcriptional regulator with XRE-family HTH domain